MVDVNAFSALPNAEPVVGSVFALRAFDVNPIGVLRGLHYAQCVPDGINVAVCGTPRSDHNAPQEGCTCGFYAYDREDQVYSNRYVGEVTAIVELSGKIIVCERGVRAAHMRIVAIAPGRRAVNPDDMMDRLRGNYPNAQFFDNVEAMKAAFPLSNLDRRQDDARDEQPNNKSKKPSSYRSLFVVRNSERICFALLYFAVIFVSGLMIWKQVAPFVGMPYLLLLVMTAGFARSVGRGFSGLFMGMIAGSSWPMINEFLKMSSSGAVSEKYGPLISQPSNVSRNGLWLEGLSDSSVHKSMVIALIGVYAIGLIGGQLQASNRRRNYIHRNVVATFPQPTLPAPPAHVLGPGVAPPGLPVIRLNHPTDLAGDSSSGADKKEENPHG